MISSGDESIRITHCRRIFTCQILHVVNVEMHVISCKGGFWNVRLWNGSLYSGWADSGSVRTLHCEANTMPALVFRWNLRFCEEAVMQSVCQDKTSLCSCTLWAALWYFRGEVQVLFGPSLLFIHGMGCPLRGEVLAVGSCLHRLLPVISKDNWALF